MAAAAVAAAGSSNVEFIRARSDKREYRRVVLANALEILLISDPDTDKAAACMEVEVGSFSDPEGLEGLAHFLEHMLFYASEKYPGEHEYTKYIIEGTYKPNSMGLLVSWSTYMPKFAQFFIKPLMSQDAVLREIKAVDSEHKKNLLSDGWRMYQLQKHFASKDHPYHKFSTGSWETLETKPKARGLDIRLELLKFYKNYSANVMHLVVYGKENLDCIQGLVERMFSDIKNTDQRSLKCPSHPLSEEHLQVEDGLLNRWAMNLMAGECSDSNEYSFFSVSMRLTDAGHERMEDIVGLIFKYLHLLKEDGVHEWIFNELAAINEMEFHYQDKVRPINYVMRTVSTMREWIEKAPTEKLHLPKPNIFIPKDLSLKEVHEKVTFPTVLRKSPLSQLWYKPDMLFSTPKVHIIIDFHCPLSSHSPEAVVATELFVDLLVDYLNAYAYDAQIAGLFYSIYVTSAGFQVSLGGYNDKMRVLLNAILVQIVKFEVKPNRFSALKETSVKDYQNFNFRQPYSQASYYVSLILGDKKWPVAEKLEALSKLESDYFAKFVPHLLSKTFLECYVQGNIEPSEAKSIVEEIENTIFTTPNSLFKSMSPSEYLIKRVIMLENDLKCYYQTEGLNQKNENSSVIQYIQVHQDDAILNIKLELFSLIAKQPAFNQLRTVEQLGYITSLSLRSDYGVLALQVVIQSTVKDPSYLDVRVDEFFKMFESKIYELSDKDFKRNVKSLIDSKLEKFKNLWEESHFYWGEIEAGTLKFDRVESEVAMLRELKKEEFIEYFNQYIKVDAPQRRTLSVQVFGGNHLVEFKKAINEANPPKMYRITDIFGFKRSRPLYSSLKGGPGRITMD
ncbi:Insulin-degrading enzyme-like 1 peroxisomal [Zea mays]|uniref:Insulin-degrading enzyme-like 1 peroxisomal n=1 Tax=Zea mays TaxID=4577 RepID=A0A1D6N9W8_MAIZE|nr:Insulin-degrading enzyme-like 1 peroxisomal [Zea mays]